MFTLDDLVKTEISGEKFNKKLFELIIPPHLTKGTDYLVNRSDELKYEKGLPILNEIIIQEVYKDKDNKEEWFDMLLSFKSLNEDKIRYGILSYRSNFYSYNYGKLSLLQIDYINFLMEYQESYISTDLLKSTSIEKVKHFRRFPWVTHKDESSLLGRYLFVDGIYTEDDLIDFKFKRSPNRLKEFFIFKKGSDIIIDAVDLLSEDDDEFERVTTISSKKFMDMYKNRLNYNEVDLDNIFDFKDRVYFIEEPNEEILDKIRFIIMDELL